MTNASLRVIPGTRSISPATPRETLDDETIYGEVTDFLSTLIKIATIGRERPDASDAVGLAKMRDLVA